MARAVLRNLLRAVHVHVRCDEKNLHFREFVVAEFRKNAGLTDVSVIKQKVSLAQDYTTLITSVHHHKDLLRSYNIDIDRTNEQQTRLIDTAGRVGLSMPQLESEEGIP